MLPKKGYLRHSLAQNMSTQVFVGHKREEEDGNYPGLLIIVGLPGIYGQVLHVLSFTQVTSSEPCAVTGQ